MAEAPKLPAPNLILQRKWEAMAKYMYSQVLRHMQRLDRSTLGVELMQPVWRTERQIINIAFTSSGREPMLRQVDLEAKTILRMVAIGVEMGSIPHKKYEHISALLVEIGKIIGGLLKR